MGGYIFAIIAGAAMSIQGVFNTRLSEKIGLYESNLVVSFVALILAVIAVAVLGKGNLFSLPGVNKLYLSGGVLGIIITITVMLSMSSLSPAVSVGTILIAQLLVAALIDAFGLFETPKSPFGLTKIIGTVLMIAGIIIFKLKK